MSLLNRDRYRKKLDKLLGKADDQDFCQLIWSVDALQTGKVDAASRHICFPPDAATSELDSKFYVKKWDLETLVGHLLTTRKLRSHGGRERRLVCTDFNVLANAINILHDLENSESAIYLRRFGVLGELHRIGQRQFPWQRGYDNIIQFYRYAYIYGQGECNAYFERSYGLTMNEFSLIGFSLHASFQEHSWVARPYSLTELGIMPAKVEAALALLSKPIVHARNGAALLIQKVNESHGAPLPTAFQPSFLRTFPIVSFGNADEILRAPLPSLLLLRITAGVYYDLVSGPSQLRNEASERFESYASEYIEAMMHRFAVVRSYKYKCQGNQIDAPDILIKNAGQVVVAVECKSTKLSFAAQFSEDPIQEAKSGYNEIAKGVFQLWRYFSHVRRGFITKDAVHPDARGLVLTLDTWLVLSKGLQDDVLAAAATLAEKDNEMTTEDRRPVIFCTIQDLESTLANSTEDSFLRAVSAACEGRFAGWILPNVLREINEKSAEPKPFPFKLDDVLPWWKATTEMAENL